MVKKVTVTFKDATYDIIISADLFDFNEVAHLLVNKKLLIVSNDIVAPLYLKALEGVLSSIQGTSIYSIVLPDGEKYKTCESWNKILDALAENSFTRSDMLISLGGGVICDMTGFAAASWMRGVDFIQVPTTLLSQVDASVGGKTGINHIKGKNLIGAFHQPKAVVINTSTLMTLPTKEVKSGLGEVVKYAYINQPQFKQWLESKSDKINQLDMKIMGELIKQCCEFKKDIVQQDEKEAGIRALLNLGHTFAHAIETYTEYRKYTHGEAVAIGMVMAAELSGIISASSTNLRKELEKHLQVFGLLTMLPSEIDANQLVKLMRLDKKAMHNNHRLILMKSIGKAFIQTNVCEKDILQAIKRCQYN